MSPDSLQRRDGCAIVLMRQDARTFVGTTQGHECQINLAGAAYATSEVTITPGELISWDRGFDPEGQQVWGAVKGGYVFKKTAG